MPWYHIKQGDCISSIASQHGWLPDTLWNHPDNSELKSSRKNPNALCPGDQVFIPEKSTSTESVGTGAKHRFRRKGVPAKLKLKIMRGTNPLANETVKLEVNGVEQELITDSQSYLEAFIPPTATQAKLTVLSTGKCMNLNLGCLNASEDITGAQARLNNLGFDTGSEDGIEGDQTRQAVRRFQKSQNLEENGQLNAATLNKLKEVHGS